jgi:Fe2+ or Zn2+ uptake regulation protein
MTVAMLTLEKKSCVKRNMSITEKSQISHEILAYLVEHPEARDTLEGILEWWLLERKIKRQKDQVKEALTELVARGLVLEHKGGNSQTQYRINQSKYKEIQKLFNQGSG